MHIRLHTVDGIAEHDLDNINNLNHYIGMKRIEPDAIPELRLMPWIIGGLMVLGLGAAAAGKRWTLYAWTALFAVVAAAGLIDFYLWAYEYGHNLDPTAAIRVPGMSYQPPLIGSKQLLNFTAHSWPALGGWATFAALGTGLALSVREFLGRRRTTASLAPAAALLGTLLLLGGCATPEPRPLRLGEDRCAHCIMSLSDDRYGAELVTQTGKVYAFDSVECLAGYLIDGRIAEADVHSLWVVDFEQPGTLISVGEAFFLHSKDLPSPMGQYLTAFGPGITRQAVSHSFFGDILTWDEVLDVVQENRLPRGLRESSAATPTAMHAH
jgi:copper chaperone NosL